MNDAQYIKLMIEIEGIRTQVRNFIAEVNETVEYLEGRKDSAEERMSEYSQGISREEAWETEPNYAYFKGMSNAFGETIDILKEKISVEGAER